MSMTLMAQAMSIKVGNPIRKLVLIKLADNANDKGECWPSYQHIAEQCEIGRSTVKSHIKALEDMGLVRREYRKNGSQNQSNLFHLNFNSPITDISKAGTVRNKAAKMVKSKPGKALGQGLIGIGHELTGVSQDLTGVSHEMTQGRSAHALGGGSGADPRTSHSSEPAIEPKNNTHTARSNFEPVVNVATAPPHECNNPQMHIGDWVQSGTWSSEELSAPELKTIFTRARHKNPVLPAAIEHVSTLIAQKTGDVQLRVNQPDPFNKHAANHIPDKFVMFNGWRPSSGLRDTAQKIGIEISGPPDQARLADFVTFWEADGAAYNQVQWEMKLARYVEKGRKHLSSKRSRERRDCTRVSEMNYEIPEGFRGG